MLDEARCGEWPAAGRTSAVGASCFAFLMIAFVFASLCMLSLLWACLINRCERNYELLALPRLSVCLFFC